MVSSFLVAAPWLGTLVGFVFAVSMIAAIVAAAYYAGPYYAVPRWIVKALPQAALRRIS
jgi:beta-lactam-binding protein with PASTA domain